MENKENKLVAPCSSRTKLLLKLSRENANLVSTLYFRKLVLQLLFQCNQTVTTIPPFDDSDADPNYSSSSSSTSSSSEDSEEELPLNRPAIEDGNEEETPNKGKKRKAKPEMWKKAIAKRRRNAGLEYTSSSKKLWDHHVVQNADSSAMKKIPKDDRKIVFAEYWNLADLQRQRDFLLKNIETVAPRYQYKRVNSNRKSNHAFYFSIRDAKFRVCKLFFRSTLGITDRPIRTVINKQTFTTKGLITPDLRGRHVRHCHINNDVKNDIRNHINSIPRINSHYCRKDSSREYIEGGKTVAQLHRDYVEMCKAGNKSYANYLMYNRIFNNEFKISFLCQKRPIKRISREKKNLKIKKIISTILSFLCMICRQFCSGHTQNEGDSVHSVIERYIKRALRSGPIFVPDQYMTLIRTAKITGKPYEVHELNHENFFNIKELASTIGRNYSKKHK
ncbi:hypothetical protein NQ318_018105 [Aromia moschata]|uniref:Uncharacterized protein n=1 Tax=Aromia moschata TaxID=1265417 RepID=A0AAV8ZFI0_9CUCU|nr:hypothetical protein NQ318_018105 [Aromia moschata]